MNIYLELNHVILVSIMKIANFLTVSKMNWRSWFSWNQDFFDRSYVSIVLKTNIFVPIKLLKLIFLFIQKSMKVSHLVLNCFGGKLIIHCDREIEISKFSIFQRRINSFFFYSIKLLKTKINVCYKSKYNVRGHSKTT